MDDELIEAHGKVPALMPFLHLPVQSGSDSILKAMNRKHTAEHYIKVIDKLKDARPDMALSSDFIVGFPGETQKDHQQTLELVQKVGYAQAYSFKYSMRPGTPAAMSDLQVEENIKVERLAELQNLLNAQQKAFNEATVGTIQRILSDRIGKFEGQLIGKTPYMQSVYFEGEPSLIGSFHDIKIENAFANSVTGSIINDVKASVSNEKLHAQAS
jgi:tRNA-2-methylthio-N6-dimethylallyladenosine synthase